MTVPNGPVWEAAAAERNWAVIKITQPRANGKSQKLGIDPDSHKVVGHEQAACLTLPEARTLLGRIKRGRHVLGYMPRPDSEMVCGDIDEAAMSDGQPPRWLYDLDRKLTTYTERSPSEGLRVLMARASASRTVPEAGGVGLYADAGKALTITGRPLDGSPLSVNTAWQIQLAFEQHAWQAGACAQRAQRPARRPSNDATAPHWFNHLPAQCQQVEVSKMLAALPAGAFADREAWLRVACAVAHALDEDGWDIFNDWSRDRAGGHYDHAENLRIWSSIGASNRAGDAITIGTLIALAREHGYEPPPGAHGVDHDLADRLAKLADRFDGADIRFTPTTKAAADDTRADAMASGVWQDGMTTADLMDAAFRPQR